jgi:hypothetical protein
MYKLYSILFGVIFSGAALATDICDEAEAQFQDAVKVYKKEGSTAFMKRVLKGGPLESDTRALSQAQALGQIEQFFGLLDSASILSKKLLGTKSCYIIGVLEYENGPAFSVANYYKGTKGVAATSMFFKTEPETILPTGFLVQ